MAQIEDKTALEVGRFVMGEVGRLFGTRNPENAKRLVGLLLTRAKGYVDNRLVVRRRTG